MSPPSLRFSAAGIHPEGRGRSPCRRWNIRLWRIRRGGSRVEGSSGGVAQFCQYIALTHHLHPSTPVIPRLREGSRTCPLTPFFAFLPHPRPLIRHSCGGRNPSLLKAHPPPSRNPFPGAEGPLILSSVEGSSGGVPALLIRRGRPPNVTRTP